MTFHQPTILAITGGIACGKSETGRILEELGFAVLDTDGLAHRLMTAGTPLFSNVVKRFGRDIIGPDGQLDRTKLGSKVFGDSTARADLNRLVHPAVIAAAEKWKAEQTGHAAVLVPLLFEAGWTDGWDAVICVSADEEAVFQRLQTRGLNREEACKRIATQMPLDEKEKRADFVIKNNDSLETLRNGVQQVLKQIQEQRKSHE